MIKRSTVRITVFTVLVTAAVLVVLSGLLAMINTKPALAQEVGRYTTQPVRGSNPLSYLGPNQLLVVGPNRNITNKNGAQSETSVAVDPTNPAHIVAASNDLSSFSTYNSVYESYNYGRTWALAGYSVNAFCYDPWVDFNADGTVLYAYECYDQRVAYRPAGSTTWTYYKMTNAGGFPDRDMIVVDRNPASAYYNRAYIGYDDANASNAAYLLYANSSNYSSWTKTPKINDSGNTIGNNAAVLSDGRVLAVWESYAQDQMRSDCSSNGGATWGTDTTVLTYRANAPQFFIYIPPQPDRGVLPMPFTAAAPAGTTYAGRAYVAYADQATSGTHWDVYVRYTDNCGATWSSEVKINDDTGTAYQFFPEPAVLPDGTVAVSWYDTRDDATNRKTHRYWSYSTNGGVTWSANERLTTAQSDESGIGDANDYGDYENTAAGNNFFYHVWTDSRPGTKAEDMAGAPSRP